MVYHPVLQDAARAGQEAQTIVSSLCDSAVQVLALLPNSDAGNDEIRAVLEAHARRGTIHLRVHLGREDFVSWMAAADIMVGNSSAGIIEAASFGTPVLNVGPRQRLRERNENVTDIDVERAGICGGIRSLLAHGRYAHRNRYGDGAAAERIVRLLQRVPLDPSVLAKVNAY
jgi:GDP/UDP-N,N'-diacetylbacillosamine 2-epimerase (hydrolysing)